MAARPVAMTGVIYPLNKKDPPMAVYIQGNAWDPRLSIWSDPIIPPAQPQPPGEPGIPTFPIAEITIRSRFFVRNAR